MILIFYFEKSLGNFQTTRRTNYTGEALISEKMAVVFWGCNAAHEHLREGEKFRGEEEEGY
jgi:formylmethanofuran dehydrogenase subunit B